MQNYSRNRITKGSSKQGLSITDQEKVQNRGKVRKEDNEGRMARGKEIEENVRKEMRWKRGKREDERVREERAYRPHLLLPEAGNEFL